MRLVYSIGIISDRPAKAAIVVPLIRGELYTLPKTRPTRLRKVELSVPPGLVFKLCRNPRRTANHEVSRSTELHDSLLGFRETTSGAQLSLPQISHEFNPVTSANRGFAAFFSRTAIPPAPSRLIEQPARPAKQCN